jgi:hypothetical protein
MKQKKESALRRYFKENLVVLLFELIIVVLLACICSLMLGGKPVWLAPALAVFAYLMAELRFMMSFVAGAARQQASDELNAVTQAEGALEDLPDEPVIEEDDEQAPYVSLAIKQKQEEIADFDEPLDEDFDEPDEDPIFDSVSAPLDLPVEEPLAQDEEVVWGSKTALTAENARDESDGLFTADINLFDEPLAQEELLVADEISDIFTESAPDVDSQETPDIFAEEVSDLRDEEDPFSH